MNGSFLTLRLQKELKITYLTTKELIKRMAELNLQPRHNFI